MQIVKWDEIRDQFTDGLLLGNGASIAVYPGFRYESLFDAATENGFITEEIANVFNAFGVNDFEYVLRRLWQAKIVNETLGIEEGRIEEAYREVRNALIQTVRHVHITHDAASGHLTPIYTFMKQFRTIVSLNYDLIVYWAAMESKNELGPWFKDCFVRGSFNEDWRSMKAPYGGAQGTTLFFYPHGNLALIRNIDDTESKLNAGNGDLLETVLNKWEEGRAVPLFVSEGTSEHKLKAIQTSSYLRQVNTGVMPTIGQSLVIYGWGMAEQERHILNSLKVAGCQCVAVSVYDGNEEYIAHATKVLKDVGIRDIRFFDSQSPGCWNNRQV